MLRCSVIRPNNPLVVVLALLTLTTGCAPEPSSGVPGGIAPATGARSSAPSAVQWPDGAGAQSVALDGTRMAVGAGAYVVIVDVSDPEAPEVLGVSESFSADISHVSLAGERALATAGGDLIVLDVADPSLPREVGRAAVGTAFDLVVYEGHAYMPMSKTFETWRLRSDSSDDPERTGSLDEPGGAWSVALAPELARGYFVTAHDDFHVLDLSEPAMPSNFVYVSFPGGGRHVAARGTDVIVATDTRELRLMDASVPESPVEVTRRRLGSVPRGVALSRGIAFVIDAEGTGEYGGRLRLFSLGEEAITPRGELMLNGEPSAIIVVGGMAFCATDEGVVVIDARDPDVPVTLAHLPERKDAPIVYLPTARLED